VSIRPLSDFATPAPIAVASDAPDLASAVVLAGQVKDSVSTFKVGLELYMRYGPDAVQQVRNAAPGRLLFLDVKLHDIPNTVGGAARAVAHLQPDILTVHAAGGAAMIAAAVEALPQTRVAAVTILTSLSAHPSMRCAGWPAWRSTPVPAHWCARRPRSLRSEARLVRRSC
jgi:orotidine-5'-phosphate decarboxylase